MPTKTRYIKSSRRQTGSGRSGKMTMTTGSGRNKSTSHRVNYKVPKCGTKAKY